MQTKHTLLQTITNSKLDVWSQNSVLASLLYVVTRSAINSAVKAIPDLPAEGAGVDTFTQYEQDCKNIDPEIRAQLASFLDLRNDLADALAQVSDSEARDLGNTLEFMTSTPPNRDSFAAEWNRRIRAGMKTHGMTMAKFMDIQYASAMDQHCTLIAKGEHAVNLLCQLEPAEAELPDWLIEAMFNKAVEKLLGRRDKQVIRAMNYRLPTEQRMDAETDIELIDAAIIALGGTVPSDEPETPEAEATTPAVFRSRLTPEQHAATANA